MVSGDQLVLLARVSFAGTGTMGALVLVGILSKHKPGVEIIIVSAGAFFIFLSSVINLIPSIVFAIRLDLFLFICLALTSIVSSLVRRNHVKQEVSHG
jgi:SSS family solute:Na+ symporter